MLLTKSVSCSFCVTSAVPWDWLCLEFCKYWSLSPWWIVMNRARSAGASSGCKGIMNLLSVNRVKDCKATLESIAKSSKISDACHYSRLRDECLKKSSHPFPMEPSLLQGWFSKRQSGQLRFLKECPQAFLVWLTVWSQASESPPCDSDFTSHAGLRAGLLGPWAWLYMGVTKDQWCAGGPGILSYTSLLWIMKKQTAIDSRPSSMLLVTQLWHRMNPVCV